MKLNVFGWLHDRSGSKAAATAPSQTSGPEPQPPNGKHVLIVDDDPVFLQATGIRLRREGFEVTAIEESSQAIAILKEQAVHAVLMDINFPPEPGCSWDGLQLMYWLRGLPQVKKTRFVVVSESDTPQNRKRSQDLGAKAYFSKPVDHDALLAVLNAEN